MFRNLLNYPSKRPKPQDLVKKWKVVKGDTVQVIRGKDKGKEGGRVFEGLHSRVEKMSGEAPN